MTLLGLSEKLAEQPRDYKDKNTIYYATAVGKSENGKVLIKSDGIVASNAEYKPVSAMLTPNNFKNGSTRLEYMPSGGRVRILVDGALLSDEEYSVNGDVVTIYALQTYEPVEVHYQSLSSFSFYGSQLVGRSIRLPFSPSDGALVYRIGNNSRESVAFTIDGDILTIPGYVIGDTSKYGIEYSVNQTFSGIPSENGDLYLPYAPTGEISVEDVSGNSLSYILNGSTLHVYVSDTVVVKWSAVYNETIGYLDFKNQRYSLPFIPDSVTMTKDGVAFSGFTVENNTIVLTAQPLDDPLYLIEGPAYYTELLDSSYFQYGHYQLKGYPETGTVTVFVNSVQTSYELVDTYLSIPSLISSIRTIQIDYTAVLPSQYLEVPTDPSVHDGDSVMVATVNGVPTVIGVKGFGDRQDEAIADAAYAADVAWNYADSAHTAASNAQASATAANYAATQAQQDAATAKEAADQAVEDAGTAYEAAQAAQTSANDAAEAAQQAQADATTAKNAATQAQADATAAKNSAIQANTHANSALTQLSIIEDVAGTLDWISKHGTYTLTSDTTVQEGTVYFEKVGNDYVPIAEPTGNPHAQGWYTLDVTDSQSDYIMAHLAVTSAGLWVLPSGIGSASDEQHAAGYKTLLSSTGMTIYDDTGRAVATYGEGIVFDSSRALKIGNNNAYIEYYDSNGDEVADSLRISANSITLGGSDIADTYATKDEAATMGEGSGESVTVDSGSRLRSLEVEGKSVQDGTPTPSSPVPIQVVDGANMIPPVYYAATRTASGITVTNNGDGTFTLNGTATATADLYLTASNLAANVIPIIANKEYRLLGMQSDKGVARTNVRLTARVRKADESGNAVYPNDYGLSATFKTTMACYVQAIFVNVTSGTTLTNLIVKPQIAQSSVTEYVPYGSLGLKVRGNNMANLAAAVAESNVSVTANSDGSLRIRTTANGTYRGAYISTANGFPLVAGKSYRGKVHVEYTSGTVVVGFRRISDHVFVGTRTPSNLTASGDIEFTLNSYDGTPVYLSILVTWSSSAAGDATFSELMVNEGSAVLPYTPYVDSLTPIPLQGNVLASLPDGTHDRLLVDSSGHKRIESISWRGTIASVGTVDTSGSTYYAAITPTDASGMRNWSSSGEFNSQPGTTRAWCSKCTSDGTGIYIARTWNSLYAYAPASLGLTQEDFNKLVGAEFVVKNKTATIDLGYITMPELADGCTVQILASLTPTFGATWYTENGAVLTDFATKSELQVTADGISSEVSTKVGSDEIVSKINQSAESVKIQASKVEIDGTATFNAIKSQTDAAYDAKGAAAAIEVGGTNLLKGSDQVSVSATDYGWVKNGQTDPDIVVKDGYRCIHCQASVTGTIIPSVATRQRINLSWGSEYTASTYLMFDKEVSVTTSTPMHYHARSSTTDNEFNVNIADAGGGVNVALVEPAVGTVIPANTWQKFVLRVTTNAAAPDSTHIYPLFRPIIYGSVRTTSETATVNTWVHGYKFELGNKATDWTPAPEDVDAAIAAAQTTANTANERAVAYRGTNNTASNTAAKTIVCKNFALVTGATVSVYNQASNSVAGTLTLNVNGTGAKTIYIGAESTSATNQLLWHIGSTITYSYDGAYWHVADMPSNYYGTSCSTAAGTAQKQTTISAGVIFKGVQLELPMQYANTAATPTLAVQNANNTASNLVNGILYGTGTIKPTVSNGYSWLAGMSVIFRFDGQYWRTGNQTIIDGGHILTGTISADRIAASSIAVGKLTVEAQSAMLNSNIEIGGTNLITGTGTNFPASGTTSSSAYFVDFNYSNGKIGNQYNLEEGVTYTFSVDVTSSTVPFDVSVGAGTGGYLRDVAQKSFSSNGRCSITFTPTAANLSQGTVFAFRAPRQGTAGAVTYTVDKPKLEIGNKATDWSPAPEDMASAADSIEYIVGTQSAATGSWTGVTKESALVAGKTIAYRLPYAGSGNASLNLTLAGGGTTGAKAVYSMTTRVTTQYPANSIIQMTYDGSYWRTTGWYNTDTNARYVQFYNTIVAKSAIRAASIIGGDSSGYEEATAGAVFDLSYPIMWTTAAIAAAKTDYSHIYTLCYDRTLATRYSSFTGAKNKIVYLVGTASGNKFTVDSSIITSTEPTEEDGKIYIPIGRLGNDTNGKNYFNFSTSLPVTPYAYLGGSFQRVDLSSSVRVSNVEGGLEMAVSDIATVSDKANAASDGVSSLNTRVNAQEETLTQVKTTFTFSTTGLTIGKSGSTMQSTFGNTSLQFKSGNTVVLELDAEKSTAKADRFAIGKYQLKSVDNGNAIAFVYVGG